MFVFDRKFHTVPDQGHICSGFYYEKSQYMPNVCNGIADDGILGHGGLFVELFHSNTPYKTILTEDITDEANLLYLIEPWPMFNGIDVEDIANPKAWHLVINHIPEKIIELARQKRLTILLHIPEFVTGLNIIKDNLDTTLKLLNIPSKQFKFISGIRDDHWYYWPGFEYSQLVCYNGSADVVKEVNVQQRNKKFTCLNRIDKMHRRYIATELWRWNLLEEGYFSYSFGQFGFEDGEYKLLKSGVDQTPHGGRGNWNIADNNWRQFYYTGPWVADTLTIEEHNHHWHIEKQHYEQAYWNFVTETGVDEYPFLSEKTFKPLANLQPFVILGGYKSLETLHDLGYKTFGDYIDESYDDIIDTEPRIQRAAHQAAQLARMSHQEHISLINKLKPILEHNQRHFFESKNRFGNFVKYIYGNDPAYNWLKDCADD